MVHFQDPFTRLLISFAWRQATVSLLALLVKGDVVWHKAKGKKYCNTDFKCFLSADTKCFSNLT